MNGFKAPAGAGQGRNILAGVKGEEGTTIMRQLRPQHGVQTCGCDLGCVPSSCKRIQSSEVYRIGEELK